MSHKDNNYLMKMKAIIDLLTCIFWKYLLSYCNEVSVIRVWDVARASLSFVITLEKSRVLVIAARVRVVKITVI